MCKLFIRFVSVPGILRIHRYIHQLLLIVSHVSLLCAPIFIELGHYDSKCVLSINILCLAGGWKSSIATSMVLEESPDRMLYYCVGPNIWEVVMDVNVRPFSLVDAFIQHLR